MIHIRFLLSTRHRWELKKEEDELVEIRLMFVGNFLMGNLDDYYGNLYPSHENLGQRSI